MAGQRSDTDNGILFVFAIVSVWRPWWKLYNTNFRTQNLRSGAPYYVRGLTNKQ